VMDKQLHELAFSIQQKEELIQELARNESEAKHLTAQYEARMLELEAEVHRHHLLLVCLQFLYIKIQYI
jgi:hypothetical protein